MSLIRSALRAAGTARLPDPRESSTLEDYAAKLAWCGLGREEGRALLASAAQQLEVQWQAEWDRLQGQRATTEALALRFAGIESVVQHWWADLGWNEAGAPDGSGPIFDTRAVEIPTSRPPSPLDVGNGDAW